MLEVLSGRAAARQHRSTATRRSLITARSPVREPRHQARPRVWDLVFRLGLTMGLKDCPPAGAWLLGIRALRFPIAGLLLLAGFRGDLHPLLQESGAGLVLVVSGVALVRVRRFPLVLAEFVAARLGWPDGK